MTRDRYLKNSPQGDLAMLLTLKLSVTLVLSAAVMMCLGGCHVLRAGHAHHQGSFRHVVVFKFVDLDKAKIAQVEADFAKLPSKIDVIQGFEWGQIDSVEGLDQGYTHGFILTFNSKADCEKYVNHPDHKAFVETIKPLLGSKKLQAFVFDYTVK
jgi:hypothetical protein